jgi:hypothetical protein
LATVHAEALARSYNFDRSKVGPVRSIPRIPVAREQLHYEWQHLLQKLSVRNPLLFTRWHGVTNPLCHPLFRPRPGPVASWERASGLADLLATVPVRRQLDSSVG